MTRIAITALLLAGCLTLDAWLLGCAGTADRVAAKVADARNAYYEQCAGRPDDLDCVGKRVATNCLIDAYNSLNEELPEP